LCYLPFFFFCNCNYHVLPTASWYNTRQPQFPSNTGHAALLTNLGPVTHMFAI